MRRQDPIDIVMALWERINTPPWITLECINKLGWGCMLHFDMVHSKTRVRKAVRLEAYLIYRIDDWTYKYVMEELTIALAALTHNTAEAGTGSLDVYREDHP